MYTTYPAAGTRHARFEILFDDGTISGTLRPSAPLPPGETDPTIVGAAGRVARGTGRFHGLIGSVELSDQSGPGSPPVVTADGVRHQSFDVGPLAAGNAFRLLPPDAWALDHVSVGDTELPVPR